MKLWTVINVPLLLYFNGSYYPQNYIWIPLLVGFIFNYYIFKKYQDWWQKYNFVFAAAASAGLGICLTFLNIGQFANFIQPIEWTGNDEGELFNIARC